MRILLSGTPVDTQKTRLFDLVPPQDGQTIIVNGFQTDADLPLSEGDTITVLTRGVLPDRDTLSQLLTARLTPGVYDRVRHARVAVAGLGGLGSHIAYALARTGVGHLHLVDCDTVDATNLNRQCYTVADLGRPKAEALADGLRQACPLVQITAQTVRITPENAAALFSQDTIVCEALDAADQKAMLIDRVLAGCPQAIVIAASGMAGVGSAGEIRTRRLSPRLYLCGDGQTAAAPGCGLMAPRVMVCAGHQANMALRLLLDMPAP